MATGSNGWAAMTLLAALVSANGGSAVADPDTSICDTDGICITNLRVERLLDTAGAVIDSIPTRHYWYRTAYTLHERDHSVDREVEIFEIEWAASEPADPEAEVPLRHGRVIDDLIARTQKRFKAGRPVRRSEFVVVRDLPRHDAAGRAASCGTT